MTLLSRRHFLHQAAAGAAWVAAVGRTVRAYPLGMPIGSQTYPHRQMVMEGNFAGLCKMMADIGVGSLELCSPGYKEFASLKDGKMVKQILDDHGLICPSAHFTLGSLRKEQPAMIQWAKDIGMTQMMVATLGGGNNPTMDQVKQAADEYNKIAAAAAKAGLQQGLHNEGFEAAMVDGRRVYDILFELLDPTLVKFQFQMSSARGLGIDPVAFLSKHKGRFISLHLQGVPGIAPRGAGAGAGAAAPGGAQAAPAAPATPAVPAAPASASTPAPPAAPAGQTPAGAAAAPGARRGGGGRGPALSVGRDSLDWAKVFQAARTGGIRNYFVEQNWELTQESVAFLKLLTA